MGATLLQQKGIDNEKEYETIGFSSQSFTHTHTPSVGTEQKKRVFVGGLGYKNSQTIN